MKDMLLHRSSIAINYKMNTFEFWAKTNSIFIVSSLYTMIEMKQLNVVTLAGQTS